MKKFFLGLFTLLLVFGISGCSNNPSDVATKFVQSISDLDAKEAKSLSSKDVQSQIEELEKFCARSKVWEISQLLNKEVKAFPKRLDKELETNLLKKYPNIKEMPRKDREKIFSKLVGDLIDDIEISSSKYKTEIKESLKKILLAMATGKRFNERVIITKELIKEGNALTKECVAKNSYFSDIDTLKIIEVADDSNDEKSVKLELVHNNGESQKITLGVEKIQDEWKVAQSNLLKYF